MSGGGARSRSTSRRTSFDVKMLRWMHVSPQGDQVVYQALGYLYVRDLPERHAAPPDEAGRPLRVLSRPARATAGRSSTRPGTTRTSAPIRVVAGRRRRRAGGDRQARPLHRAGVLAGRLDDRLPHEPATATCVTAALVAGDRHLHASRPPAGKPTLVTKSGALAAVRRVERPHLLRDRRGEGQARSALDRHRSASDERAARHHREFATEYALSPDEKWLAFRETLQRVRHAVRAHRQDDRHRPEDERDPGARRSTQDAGEYLHWSGDAQRLYWSLGPELFTARSQGRLRVPRRRAREAARRAGEGRATSASRSRPTCRPARSRSPARASSR